MAPVHITVEVTDGMTKSLRRNCDASTKEDSSTKAPRRLVQPASYFAQRFRVAGITTRKCGPRVHRNGKSVLMLTGRLRPAYVCCSFAPPPKWPAQAGLLRSMHRSADRAEWLHPFARTPQAGDGLRSSETDLFARPRRRCIKSSRFGKQWRAARGNRAWTALPEDQDQQRGGRLDRGSHGHRPGHV